MPPPRYNSIGDARRQLFDEPMPAQYFAPPSPYRTAEAMASDRAAMDELEAARDAAETKAAQNRFTRLSLGERSRIMPYSTAATIAQQKFIPKQVAADEEVLPFATENAVQKHRTGAEIAAMRRRQLGDEEEWAKLEHEAKVKAAQDADPHYTRLTRLAKNDPHAAALYEARLRNSPAKNLEEARQLAYGDAMKLVRDREAVNAIDAMDATDGASTRRDELLKDVQDEETGEYLGSVIRQDATPEQIAKVTAALRASRNEKRLNAGTSRNIDFLSDGIKMLNSQLAAWDRGNKDNASDTPEITEVRREVANLWKERRDLQRKPIPASGGGVPAAGAAPSADADTLGELVPPKPKPPPKK